MREYAIVLHASIADQFITVTDLMRGGKIMSYSRVTRSTNKS